jgi:hypothetical protein
MSRLDMLEKYVQLGGEREVWHGEYKGTLRALQNCNDGYYCGIYHFEGGDCCDGKLIRINPANKTIGRNSQCQ